MASSSRPSCTKLTDDVFELYKPSVGSISVEIIFFHGFQTDECEDAYLQTWMQGDGSACWLNTWLPERIPQGRVLSVSYDSSTQITSSKGREDMYLTGERLVHSLIGIVGVGQKCPVVLVGHCVGGLVLKTICLKANQFGTLAEGLAFQNFLKNLKGIFFYATAHLGSEVSLRFKFKQMGPLLEYFQLLSTESARLNAEFASLRHQHGWRTFAVNESNETEVAVSGQEFIKSSEYSLVVTEASARIDVDYFSTIPGVDHFTICKPKDQNSNSFLLLVKFVEEICNELEANRANVRQYLQLSKDLIGMDARMETVHKLLELQNSKAVRLSLVGMDGIGKSTLAKEILVSIQHQFEYTCFVELEDAAHKLDWGDFEKLIAEHLFDGSGRKVSLSGDTPWFLLDKKKVLFIVDDAGSEHVPLISQLLVSTGCGEQSRLIITSCIKDLMRGFIQYDIPLMSNWESVKLLEAHVEKDVLQKIRKTPELVAGIVDECDGLPLLLEMMGCYLCNEADVMVWTGAVDRLRTASSLNGGGKNRLWSKLQVIFNDLQETEQRIFLDLATFDLFGPEKKQYDWEILKTAWRTGLGAEGLYADMALRNLGDRSFLRIIPHEQWMELGRIIHVPVASTFSLQDRICTVYIHKTLRNMGRWLSGPRNPENAKSGGRIWKLEDAIHLLHERKKEVPRAENKNLEVLELSLPKELEGSSLSSPICIKLSSDNNFEALRMLRMTNINVMDVGDKWILPRSLAMLHMTACSVIRRRKSFNFWKRRLEWPIRSENVESLDRLSVLLLDNCGDVHLPQNFHRLKSLRILEIRVHGNGTRKMQLPERFGLLPALKVLSLDAPVDKLPDSLLGLSSLRSMKISNSVLLKAWPIPKSVNASNCLPSLIRLELANLPALVELPDTFGQMRFLQELILKHCPALKGLPESFSDLQQLTTFEIDGCSALKGLPESFGDLHQLTTLEINCCAALKGLPDSFGDLHQLTKLEIQYCFALKGLPNSFGDLHQLTTLDIRHCFALKVLPESFDHLHQLTELEIWGCFALKGLPERFGNLHQLTKLEVWDCSALEVLPESFGDLHQLTTLKIRDCSALKGLPDSFGYLHELTEMEIWGCFALKELPESFGDLHQLTTLRISYCHALKVLPESFVKLHQLTTLGIQSCYAFEGLPESFGGLHQLTRLTIGDCSLLEGLPERFGDVHQLTTLIIQGCSELKRLPESFGDLQQLTTLDIQCSPLEGLPESFGKLHQLTDLVIYVDYTMKELPESFCDLHQLTRLTIGDCTALKGLPERFGDLHRLTTLEINGCSALEGLPESFHHLHRLTTLDIRGCSELKRLPESIGHLHQLTTLDIRDCFALEGLPDSFGDLHQLTRLSIWDCSALKGLPESFGHLHQLTTLDIQNCSALEGLPESFGDLPQLTELRIGYCLALKRLPPALKGLPRKLGDLHQLETLDIRGCSTLKGLPKSFGDPDPLTGLGLQGFDDPYQLTDLGIGH